MAQVGFVFHTTYGATLPYDNLMIFTLIEDGESKILSCKDFADPQKRNTFIAGTTKAAAVRASAS